MPNSYYTYMMTNQSNTTLYIGVTNNIERRALEHIEEFGAAFTSKYKINKLVYFCRDGGMVDTRDLKSLGQEWLCGFESRSRHPLNYIIKLCVNLELF